MTDHADKVAKHRVQRLLSGWNKVESALALSAFALISFLTIYDVISREVFAPLLYALDMPPNALVIQGGAKIGVYALILGAFIGLGIATQSGTQIVPRVAFRWVPQRWSQQVNRMSDLFAGVFFLGAATIAVDFVQSSKGSGMLTNAGIRIPVWTIQTIMPFGFLSVSLRYFIFAIWPEYRPELPEISE